MCIGVRCVHVGIGMYVCMYVSVCMCGCVCIGMYVGLVDVQVQGFAC